MTAALPERLSLNTATIRKQWTLAQAIDGCARHGIRGISPWRDQVAALGLQQTKKLVDENGLTVTGLCRGGFFTAENWLDDNRRAIEEAHVLGARCLVLVVGGLHAGSKDLMRARESVKNAISRILPEARQAKVPLAIEPLHPMQAAERACVNTLEQALDLCDALGDGGDRGGVGLHAFEARVGDPRVLAEQAQRLSPVAGDVDGGLAVGLTRVAGEDGQELDARTGTCPGRHRRPEREDAVVQVRRDDDDPVCGRRGGHGAL